MRVLVHAEVELAAIDGSTSWLISISRCLAMAGADVDVMARNVPTRAIVLDELRSHPSIRVLYPNGAAANEPDVVAAAITERHERDPYDMIVVRGPRTARILCGAAQVRSVLWYYTVGLPSITDAPFDGLLELTREVALNARGVFAQTPWLRDYLHALIPETVGKTEVLPPMVPDEFFQTRRRSRTGRLRLGYAGKFDRPWHTLEIPDLVAALARRGVEAAVTMHGDKVQAAKGDPTWHVRMRTLIQDPPPGVHFPGALQRSRVPAFMADCDLGVGWRDGALDTSYEVSTKLLEFSAAGVPVVCNDTAIHRSIFGDDFPLYVRDDIDDVVDRIDGFLSSNASVDALGREVSEAVRDFSFTATAERLRVLLTRVASTRSLQTTGVSQAAYLHDPGYPSGDVVRAISLLTPTVVSTPKQAAKSGRWLADADVVIVDLSRRAVDALPTALEVPVVAFAAPGVDGRGLINAHRLSALSGVISPDADLLALVSHARARCRTLQLDPSGLIPAVARGWGRTAPSRVSIVLSLGDTEASGALLAAAAEAVRAAEGLCRVSIVVLEPWTWDGPSPRTTAHRFSRDVHLALADVATADIEVVSKVRHDTRWLAETGVLVPLGLTRSDRALAHECARHGGTVLATTAIGAPRGAALSVTRQLSRSALVAALAHHRSHMPEPGSAERERLQHFLEEISRAASR